jgi:hypothetical protein
MSAFWFAVVVVSLGYGVRASVRTFRREMAIDENVWLMVMCLGVIAFYWLVNAL